MTSIYNRTKHSNNRTQRNNTVAFVLEASNLPLASQCATLAAVSASKNACKLTQRLVLQEHHFKTRPTNPTFSKERLSSLCFPACFFSWRLGERAARWSVSVYAAELSPFTPFVVVLEREGVLNPSRSTSSKRFPSVSTWTPHPVKVKLYERDKGASRISGLTRHTAPEIYCLLMGLAKRWGGSVAHKSSTNTGLRPTLPCPVREQGRDTETSS